MAAKNWTEQQKNCINSRGGTLLVWPRPAPAKPLFWWNG